MNLNRRAGNCCQKMIDRAELLRVEVTRSNCGTRLIDCGISASGGLQAGLLLARVSLADLAQVELLPADEKIWPGVAVSVMTDHPVAACMASQYAGWQVTGEKYFAMGSGPMRAAAGREEVFDKIGWRESASQAVGVLEAGRLPPDDVCRQLAEACDISPKNLTLLVAPTSSQAGNLQIVARTVETALHKMLELGFDIHRVKSGYGIAPLPPVAGSDLAGIGRTNDAVLYGGQVTLWVRGEDADLAEIGPQIPSIASSDYGEPFAEIFERYNRDFYKIDPHLFSPAVVSLVNLDSGNSFRFGEINAQVIQKSFGN